MSKQMDPARRRWLGLALMATGVTALGACGGGADAAPNDDGPVAPGPSPTPSPTPTPTPTPSPTPTPTPAPTPTPTPSPTPAPTPTPTPAPTPTPSPPPAGNVITADPSNYLGKLAALRPGDTLLLAAGNYGVDGSGNDTSNVPGLPIFGLHGTAAAPITITGPESGARPVLMGRSLYNTVRLDDASHIVIRKLVVDGRNRGGAGVANQGPTHHITVEDVIFRGLSDDQQTVAISVNAYPAWNWTIRGNDFEDAGTGIYMGNSDGRNPVVACVIERNVFRQTLGYNVQVKHQVVWSGVPADMPTGKTRTLIRHNVFSKNASSSVGALARPNLLVGDQPPSGPGSQNGFEIYGNFFWQNPTEVLFQGEGNIAFYDNLLVTGGDAVAVQQHNGVVRDVRVFHNTIVATGRGISVSGGAAGYTQRVLANAVFAATPVSVAGTGASQASNIVDTRANAALYLNDPLAALATLDLYPRAGKLTGTAVDLTGLDAYTDGLRDFNGSVRDAAFRGAYSGEGSNPGWRPALARKP